MLPRPHIRAACLSGLAEALASAGVSPDEVYRATGLALPSVTEPQQWLPLHNVVALFEAAADCLKSDTVGLRLGAALDPRELGLLTYLVFTAPTFRAGIQSLQRYIRLLSDGADIVLQVAGNAATMSCAMTVPDIVERRQLAEWAVAVMFNGMREMIESRWTPQEVHFEHGSPVEVAPYEKYFSARVLFDQPDNGLVFDAALLNLRPRSADPRLHRILETHASAMLAGRPHEDGVIDLLRAFVVRTLSRGYPTINVAAQELGVSVRTLQRRLREIGTDYTELVDDMRRDLARTYLDEEGLSLKEIAHLLGYSQPSAFNRAWRRWAGGTPQEYRNREQS